MLRSRALQVVLIATLIGVAWWVIWRKPMLDAAKAGLQGLPNIEALNETRRTNAQIVGGVALLIGVFFTWRQLQISEQGQLTDRFTRAVDHLGSNNVEGRVGGIYALERIAMDSPRDRKPVAELICSFLRRRERTEEEGWPYKQRVGDPPSRDDKLFPSALRSVGWEPNVPEDVRAAVTVLRRRSGQWKEMHPLFLDGADLRRTDLKGTDLRGASLVGARLESSILDGAKMKKCDLLMSKAAKASMVKVDLRHARITWADLSFADLREADLRKAFAGDWSEMDDEEEESLGWSRDRPSVKLDEADLKGATISGASIFGARVEGADLSGIEGLNVDQIKYMFANEETRWPGYAGKVEEGSG